MRAKDLRGRAIEEMINGIKTIKYNSMEKFFLERVIYLYFIYRLVKKEILN